MSAAFDTQPVPPGQGVKRCVGCGQIKPIAEFYLRHVGGTDRINRCRDCDNAKPRSRNAVKILRVRARHRATAELIKRHDNEFRDLLDYFTRTVTEEANQLAVDPPNPKTCELDETPRLRPGKKRRGQKPADRIDVARCPHCVKHHDRGHACAKCGAKPSHALHRPDDGVLDEVAIERRIKGEPVQLTTPELAAAARPLSARGLSPSRISRELHISGGQVAKMLAGTNDDQSAAS